IGPGRSLEQVAQNLRVRQCIAGVDKGHPVAPAKCDALVHRVVDAAVWLAGPEADEVISGTKEIDRAIRRASVHDDHLVIREALSGDAIQRPVQTIAHVEVDRYDTEPWRHAALAHRWTNRKRSVAWALPARASCGSFGPRILQALASYGAGFRERYCFARSAAARRTGQTHRLRGRPRIRRAGRRPHRPFRARDGRHRLFRPGLCRRGPEISRGPQADRLLP